LLAEISWSGVKFFWPWLGQPFMVWSWVWKISPQNVKFFNFFPSGQKKSFGVGSKSTRVKGRSASYLLRLKSMLEFGQISNIFYSWYKITKFHLYEFCEFWWPLAWVEWIFVSLKKNINVSSFNGIIYILFTKSKELNIPTTEAMEVREWISNGRRPKQKMPWAENLSYTFSFLPVLSS